MGKPARIRATKSATRGAPPRRNVATAPLTTVKAKTLEGAGRRDVAALESKINRVLARLMRAASADRCTLRFDDEERGWSLALPCSEARRAGVATLKLDGSINQRAAATAQWIDKHRRNLIQPDVTRATDPAPPPALLTVYGVKAQMLSPIFGKNGWLQGWISVHYLKGPYAIGDKEIAALEHANAEVRRLVGID